MSGRGIFPGNVYAYRCDNDQGYGIMVPVKTSRGWDLIDTYHLSPPSMKPGETLDEASVREITELGSGEYDGYVSRVVSDIQRREVAARIREILRDDPHGWLDAMVVNAVTDVLGEGVAIGETVADLIDRPTCNDVGDDWEFHCSACGCELDIREKEVGEPTMWKDGAAQVPKYCPNCGAEVVITSD
ncbi:hypothetical protein [uncultured Senegalimassilia sp.]|uniref:hypothetical protein n=1 Tax=uncultured Senegalimassilia sp. TaxID=1714350 RepID=UPI00261A5580|nr:hypothetical protein [uncultured Senegalimassilia sp.]